MGQVLGGFVVVYLISLITENLTRKTTNDPVFGKISAVILSWLICSTIAGFGMADSGSYYWAAFATYGLSAIFVAVIRFVEGIRARRAIGEE